MVIFVLDIIEKWKSHTYEKTINKHLVLNLTMDLIIV